MPVSRLYMPDRKQDQMAVVEDMETRGQDASELIAVQLKHSCTKLSD